MEPDRQTVAGRKISRDIDPRWTVATSKRSSSRVKKSRLSRKRGKNFESTDEGFRGRFFDGGWSRGERRKKERKKERKREKGRWKTKSRKQQSRIRWVSGAGAKPKRSEETGELLDGRNFNFSPSAVLFPPSNHPLPPRWCSSLLGPR